MSRKILLLDASNLVYRYTATMPNAQNKAGLPIAGLYGLVKGSRDLIAANGFKHVVAVMDYGVPQYRLTLYPEYKGQRKDKRKADPKHEAIYAAYKAQLGHIKTVCKASGITTCRAKGWEADDALAALAVEVFPDDEITLVSSDKDFTTIASDRVKVFDPVGKTFREPDPLYWLRSLMNPKASDNLNGITGIGPVKADKLATAWVNAREPENMMDVEDFISWCVKNQGDKLCAAVVAEQQVLRVNAKITDMFYAAKECAPHLKYQRSTPDRDAFRKMAKDYGMTPVLEDFTAIWPPLERLTPPV